VFAAQAMYVARTPTVLGRRQQSRRLGKILMDITFTAIGAASEQITARLQTSQRDSRRHRKLYDYNDIAFCSQIHKCVYRYHGP